MSPTQEAIQDLQLAAMRDKTLAGPLATLLASHDKLVEGLRPLAAAHNERPEVNDTHPDYDLETIWESPAATTLTYGHLRNAAALLKELGQ